MKTADISRLFWRSMRVRHWRTRWWNSTHHRSRRYNLSITWSPSTWTISITPKAVLIVLPFFTFGFSHLRNAREIVPDLIPVSWCILKIMIWVRHFVYPVNTFNFYIVCLTFCGLPRSEKSWHVPWSQNECGRLLRMEVSSMAFISSLTGFKALNDLLLLPKYCPSRDRLVLLYHVTMHKCSKTNRRPNEEY